MPKRDEARTERTTGAKASEEHPLSLEKETVRDLEASEQQVDKLKGATGGQVCTHY